MRYNTLKEYEGIVIIAGSATNQYEILMDEPGYFKLRDIETDKIYRDMSYSLTAIREYLEDGSWKMVDTTVSSYPIY